MKRVYIVAVMITVVVGALSAEIQGLQFEPKQFDENSYTILLSDSMTQVEPRTLDSQSYDFDFKDKQARFEIRYTLFSQKGSIKDPKVQVAIWATMVVSNMTGYEPSTKSTTAFKDEDVKAEFNADYGITSFAQGGKTDFTEGYKYIMINFFYKKDLGIMCQAIMFNDMAFAQTEEFIKQFHSFRYN